MRLQRFYRFSFLLFMLLLSTGLVSPTLNAQSPSSTQARVYSVGIVPQFEARRLHAIWRPILDQLETKTGLRFMLKGSPTIPAFEREFMAGQFDFAYMNPYHIMLAHKTVGYVPLVRDVGRSLSGVLVVRKDSAIDSLTQLQGKRVAFPAPNALGASLQNRQELLDQFGVEVQPLYVKTHDSVYLNVALGQVSAGGGVQKTLNRQPADIGGLLKVLHRTTAVAPHPFAAHPRIATELQQKVQQAFLEIAATAAGKALFAEIPIKQAGPASMADYAPLQQMGLERFYESAP